MAIYVINAQDFTDACLFANREYLDQVFEEGAKRISVGDTVVIKRKNQDGKHRIVRTINTQMALDELKKHTTKMALL